MATRNDWRALLLREYAPAQRTVADAYTRATIALNPYIDALQVAMGDLPEDMNTRGALYTLPEYQRLVNATDDTMQRFSTTVERVSTALQDTATASGLLIAEQLAGAAVRDVWRRATSDAVSNLINFVDSPAMRSRFNTFGTNAAQGIANTVITNFVQGRGALATARAVRDFVNVTPLSWANNITRTVQIYSYRYANHAAYQANSSILEGWRWSSAKDARTCISCWCQDGKVFSVDQTLNDHHQGRCAPIPIVKGSSITWDTGETVFNRLDESRQREIMGTGAYDAWKRGEVSFSEFSRPYTDSVYGEMLRRATNRELGIAA
jgi:F like protein